MNEISMDELSAINNVLISEIVLITDIRGSYNRNISKHMHRNESVYQKLYQYVLISEVLITDIECLRKSQLCCIRMTSTSLGLFVIYVI